MQAHSAKQKKLVILKPLFLSPPWTWYSIRFVIHP